jgi:hypothetical protein
MSLLNRKIFSLRKNIIAGILTNLKTFYYLGMEMNANVMHVKKCNIIKVFSIFILFIFIYFLAV